MTQHAGASSGPLPARPLRAADYFTLNTYWFALSFLWNSMGPILLPTMVPLLVPESQKGGALGILSACGLIVAIVVQPLAGAWSDSHTTRWAPPAYLVGGTLGDVVFLLLMATAGSYWVLLTGYLLLQTAPTSLTALTKGTYRTWCRSPSAGR